MQISGFLVERISEFINDKSEFHRFPSPSETRQKNNKYYNGVSIMATRGDCKATLEGTLPSGNPAQVEIDAYKLHEEWKRITEKRIAQFQGEMLSLEGKKLDIEQNGGYHANYESLRKNL